jgi:exosortase K
VKRWQVVGVVATLAVIVAGKQLYRDASAEDLRPLLAPIAKLVSWLTGGNFVHEPGVGWTDTRLMFVIAPACAGVNFALAAFLAVSLGSLPAMVSARTTTARLAFAALLAYVATIVVNTVRIAIAVKMHTGGDAHRIEGIIVYLGGLLGLYALAVGIERRRTWVAIPLAAYVAITLVLPALNGAALHAAFWAHAAVVLAACALVAITMRRTA